jgi:hypothetical protein
MTTHVRARLHFGLYEVPHTKKSVNAHDV